MVQRLAALVRSLLNPCVTSHPQRAARIHMSTHIHVLGKPTERHEHSPTHPSRMRVTHRGLPRDEFHWRIHVELLGERGWKRIPICDADLARTAIICIC